MYYIYIHYTYIYRNSDPRHKDVHDRCDMYEHNVRSVTSQPCQSRSRHVSFFKDSSALLNN